MFYTLTADRMHALLIDSSMANWFKKLIYPKKMKLTSTIFLFQSHFTDRKKQNIIKFYDIYRNSMCCVSLYRV